jgi:hypothetical protein
MISFGTVRFDLVAQMHPGSTQNKNKGTSEHGSSISQWLQGIEV